MHTADSTTLTEQACSDDGASSPSVVTWWRRPVVLSGLLVLVTLLAYARLYRAELLDLDDHENITFNGLINPPSWSGLATLWREPFFGMYAPLSYTLLAGECWVAQHLPGTDGHHLDPTIFHAGNVALHATCVLLVFLILRGLVADDVAAAMGALLFSLHPLQVEAVAWVTEVRGMLCGLLALLSIYAYLRFLGPPPPIKGAHADQTPRMGSRGRTAFYIVALVAYLLALLSKPSAAAVPLILMIFEGVLYQRSWRPMLARLAWWGVPAIGLAWWTRQLQDDSVSRFVFEPAWWQRPFVALDALTFYLGKLLMPVGLAFDHGRSPQTVLAQWSTYVIWLVPVGLVTLLAWLPGRRWWLTVCGIFVAGLLPSLGLVSFAFQDLSTVAERFAFLAMLGPALAVAWMMTWPSVRPWRGELSLVLVGLALVTVRQTGFWHDTQTLLAHGLAVHPNSTLCLTNEALQRAEAGDLTAAEMLLDRVVAINPNEARVWMNLAAVYTRQGRPADAIGALERAVEQHSAEPQPKLDLARVLLEQNDYERIVSLLQEVVQVRPQDLEAHTYLGIAHSNLGQPAEASVHWSIVVQAQPENVAARQMLGESLAQAGRRTEALEQLREVLRRQPDNQRAADFIRAVESQSPADQPAGP
ncbi:MAG: tetratricopeptide repeat protein [Pirellulales bacterium]|nr:tetratricopeptide repeat protein [Pirellulales bacterium]